MGSRVEPYPGLFTKTSVIQIGYGLWVNLITVTIGLAFGFPSIQIPQLMSPTSDFKVTDEEATWIASIVTLFCPVGCVIGGILMDKFGRAIMVQYCQLPILVGWIYTVIANSANHMIIARALLGIGCGFAMGPSRLFTSEISLPNMRGLLGALPNTFIALGMSSQAALGLLFPWRSLCYICGAFSIALFISYHFLSETPYYVLIRENAAHARRALAKFRAKNYNTEKEVNDLIEFKQENEIRSLNCRETLKALTSSSAYKPFVILTVFITCGCLSGGPIVTFWTIEFLLVLLFEMIKPATPVEAVNSTLDVYEGNFYIAFTRLVFSIITSAILFRTPRKTLALVSVGGVSVTWFAMAVLLHIEKMSTVGPEIFLIIFTAFSSMSYYMLPFLLMAELYPLQIKGTLTGISISVTSFENFLTAKCFHILRDDLGIPKTTIMFSASSLFCFIFLYLFLPETKGLTLRQMERFFNNGPLVSSKTAGPYKSKKSNINIIEKREFVEVPENVAKTSSLISRESKKSVSLQVDGKQYKSVTSAEKPESDGNERGSSKSDEPSSSKSAK